MLGAVALEASLALLEEVGMAQVATLIEQGKGGESFSPFTYACRPPGAYHGPFRSDKGCLLLEIHYYDPA